MLHRQQARRALLQYGLDALRARRRRWRKPGKRAGERKKREPEEEGETDSGPRSHLSARGSTVLSGTTSVLLNLEFILNSLRPA